MGLVLWGRAQPIQGARSLPGIVRGTSGPAEWNQAQGGKRAEGAVTVLSSVTVSANRNASRRRLTQDQERWRAFALGRTLPHVQPRCSSAARVPVAILPGPRTELKPITSCLGAGARGLLVCAPSALGPHSGLQSSSQQSTALRESQKDGDPRPRLHVALLPPVSPRPHIPKAVPEGGEGLD